MTRTMTFQFSVRPDFISPLHRLPPPPRPLTIPRSGFKRMSDQSRPDPIDPEEQLNKLV